MSTTIKEPLTVSHVRLAKKEGVTLAFANVQVAGLINLHGVKVNKATDGHLYIAMPGQKRMKDGKEVIDTERDKVIYDNYFYPASNDARNMLTTAVLNAYAAKVAEEKAKSV